LIAMAAGELRQLVRINAEVAEQPGMFSVS
jgi:hypothetical protein